MKIAIKELTGSRQFCPFNIDSFKYLDGCERGKVLLDDLFSLYEAVSFVFTSPGNSFQRNVIYELNRPFNYAPPVEYSLYQTSRDHPKIKQQFDNIISELLGLLNGFRHRQVDLQVLSKIAHESKITLTSDWLTKAGMARTLETFTNIPDELKNNMILESVDLWSQFGKPKAGH